MFDARAAIVTGAASGIGRAVADRFACDRWRVVLVDCNEAAGEEAASDVREIGGATEFRALDVSCGAAVEAFAEASFADGASVEAVIKSAGILENAVQLPAMPMAECDAVLSVNLRGAVLMGRAFGARL